MPLEHFGYLDHGLEATATDPPIPFSKESPGPTLGAILPKPSEHFLGRPGPTGLEIELQQL